MSNWRFLRSFLTAFSPKPIMRLNCGNWVKVGMLLECCACPVCITICGPVTSQMIRLVEYKIGPKFRWLVPQCSREYYPSDYFLERKNWKNFFHFSGNRNNGWDTASCGDLLDPSFAKMLVPSNHFIGGQDALSGTVHSGTGVISAVNRSKYALSYINANLKVLLEVGFSVL